MLSRLHYLPRRCSCHRRFYSREIENLQNGAQDNEVKINLDSPKRVGYGHRQTVDAKPIDQRLQMHRLRNNFVKPGPGLRLAKNRSDLVAEFFDLSKSVMEGRLTVSELKNSQTFLQLEDELNHHIDVMSNNQVVNMVASLVKMGFDPSTNVLRLLEHEVKFRINYLTLPQMMKLLKFYSAIETSFEQKQVTDALNNRLRSTLLSNRASLDELLEIYHHLAEQDRQTNMLSLTEEKMLGILTDVEPEEDDVISRYLPKTSPYSYNALCNIFIELASVKRRPTPLLKAASQALYKLPLPQDKHELPSLSTLVSTLSSLVSLNYTNRLLVGKLITDLTDMVKLDELTSATQYNLLRIIGSLKWRPEKLLKIFYDYIMTQNEDLEKVDHNVVLTLFHITAHLNYKPDIDILEFYNRCMRTTREASIARNSRKWLSFVWSLAVLNIATDEHYDSVLRDTFIRALENPLNIQKFNHADIMKLLNLRALAKIENRNVSSHSEMLDELAKVEIQMGADHQKFSAKIRDALSGIVKRSENLAYGKQTPFGFVIDCGVKLTPDLEIEAIDDQTMETDLAEFTRKRVENRDNDTKIALVFVLFNESLASHPNEPVGHRKIISRILDGVGYKTIFIQEIVLNRFKTSSDLAVSIQDMLKEARYKK